MTATALAVIGVTVAVILAAEKIPHALTALVRACIPLVHALRELMLCLRGSAPQGYDSPSDLHSAPTVPAEDSDQHTGGVDQENLGRDESSSVRRPS